MASTQETATPIRPANEENTPQVRCDPFRIGLAQTTLQDLISLGRRKFQVPIHLPPPAT